MKLPYRKNAIIHRRKITHYLLSLTHPVGKSKAVFFRGIGFNEENIERLKQNLYEIVQNDIVTKTKPSGDNKGMNYEIIGPLMAPNGKIYPIRTVWEIKNGAIIPSFITAYPV